MRVRTGRFKKLRSGESGQAQAIEPRDRQHTVQQLATVAPPAMTVSRHTVCHCDVCTQGLQRPEHGGAALPLLELDSTEPMAYPFIKRSPECFGLRQPEVALPSQQIDTQAVHHVLDLVTQVDRTVL